MAAPRGSHKSGTPHWWAQRVTALDAHRGQDDLAGPRLHLEVLHRPQRLGDALGQGELVLGGDLGEHGLGGGRGHDKAECKRLSPEAQTRERCRRSSSTRVPPTSVVLALPSSRLKPASSKKRRPRSLRR